MLPLLWVLRLGSFSADQWRRTSAAMARGFVLAAIATSASGSWAAKMWILAPAARLTRSARSVWRRLAVLTNPYKQQVHIKSHLKSNL